MADRSGALRSFDGLNGTMLWRVAPSATPPSTSPIVVKYGMDADTPWKVLVGTDQGEVHLADARTGALMWSRTLAPKEVVGDFALGDISGEGRLDLVFSTSGSRIVAATPADGGETWSRKFKVPVKEFFAARERRKVARDVLTGQSVLADIDGDGKLDVIVDIRGLNNCIFGFQGSEGRVLWTNGNKSLLLNPALNESTTLTCCMDGIPLGSYSVMVPSYSQPTPLLAVFDGDGQADLIINDRDEVGLISVPLPAKVAPGTWSRYVANSCNNNVNFSLPWRGDAPAPKILLSVEPGEI